MRLLFGLLIAALGAMSIAITARYGFKMADTAIDGTIAAGIFALISVCVLAFHGAAVRLWFSGFRHASLFIGLVGVAALVVAFSNSLWWNREPRRRHPG